MSGLTPNQRSELQQRRTALYRQIQCFHTIQSLYMAGIKTWIEEHNPEPESEPEDTKLWLPSELAAPVRTSMCGTDIVKIENDLRRAQCHDALDKLCNHLRTQSHYIRHRNIDGWGQRSNTRAHALIDRLAARVSAAAAKYDRAREALVSLNGQGQGRKVISWIWTTTGILNEGRDIGLSAALRVEWAKSRAHSLRWTEEVMLLKEEMRRFTELWENVKEARMDGMVAQEDLSGEGLSREAATEEHDEDLEEDEDPEDD
ncbi:hypothetical protein BV22DRAFT_1052216 [Leucogyrophana mollusca]|uniref:Uncharacterized protein n=1 Tax=Leucogyrophana mollusca TaxID=85980 RepID=A0ACB8AW63_9AGAM|nr:hypothetical protein BV22DRAFT_1052216 [Leucogyrophana mollusca]